MTDIGSNFLLGVNYWPRTKATRMWSDFEPSIIAEDFALIARLGMSTVRLFLLWDDFQPEPTSVSEIALSRLAKVCDLAGDRKLSLNTTFFIGHMSGPNWIPGWLLDSGCKPAGVRQVVSGHTVVNRNYRNPFVERSVIDAQALLLERVVERFKDHPAIGIWNLGNEPDLVALPPTSAVGAQWTRRMALGRSPKRGRFQATGRCEVSSWHLKKT